MRISVADAEGQWSELLRLAENGEEIFIMRDDLIVAELLPARQPVKKPLSPEEKAKIFDEIQERVRQERLPPGLDAARSQDFLYDDFGIPKSSSSTPRH